MFCEIGRSTKRDDVDSRERPLVVYVGFDRGYTDTSGTEVSKQSPRAGLGGSQRPRLPWMTPEYSPALTWVTTGFGMGPGGSTSLSATSPPDRPGVVTAQGRGSGPCAGAEGVNLPGGNKARCGTDVPSSAMSTAQLRSVARRPPAASQPGHLPGALLVFQMGILVLGRGSRLDAFSGSPVRTWLPSGAGCPTTGTPAVRPARSSRTRDGRPHTPIACGG